MLNINWDVKLGKKIEYFDPILSYEITKYRPINMTQGLDFDMEPFIEVGRTKEKTGRYTTYPKGTKAFRDWWLEQLKRCKYGFEHGGYRITGDHYFFLNFYTLMKIDPSKKAGEGRDDGRPDFRAKQYEYFHFIEMCEILKKDVISFKARGVESCPLLW